MGGTYNGGSTIGYVENYNNKYSCTYRSTDGTCLNRIGENYKKTCDFIKNCRFRIVPNRSDEVNPQNTKGLKSLTTLSEKELEELRKVAEQKRKRYEAIQRNFKGIVWNKVLVYKQNKKSRYTVSLGKCNCKHIPPEYYISRKNIYYEKIMEAFSNINDLYTNLFSFEIEKSGNYRELAKQNYNRIIELSSITEGVFPFETISLVIRRNSVQENKYGVVERNTFIKRILKALIYVQRYNKLDITEICK